MNDRFQVNQPTIVCLLLFILSICYIKADEPLNKNGGITGTGSPRLNAVGSSPHPLASHFQLAVLGNLWDDYKIVKLKHELSSLESEKELTLGEIEKAPKVKIQSKPKEIDRDKLSKRLDEIKKELQEIEEKLDKIRKDPTKNVSNMFLNYYYEKNDRSDKDYHKFGLSFEGFSLPGYGKVEDDENVRGYFSIGSSAKAKIWFGEHFEYKFALTLPIYETFGAELGVQKTNNLKYSKMGGLFLAHPKNINNRVTIFSLEGDEGYGVELSYQVLEKSVLKAEYIKEELSNNEHDSFQIGVNYKF